jgi:type IX secretion system PorP/SprF family membrane protein
MPFKRAMIMKRLLSIVLVFTALGLSAQQDPQFTMNFANKLFNNPAYAGTNKICATGIFRNQWTAFEGAPRDILFSIHSPIKLKMFEESSLINPGVGFTFINDQIGPISTNGFKLALANHMRFSSIGTISVGAGLGALGVTIDPSKFVTPDGQNASTGIVDPGLANTNLQGYGFDLDFGVYYQSSDDKIWAGASMLHIIPNEFTGTDNTTGGETKYRVQSHMYFMGGYNIEGFLGSPDWDLLPSAFVKTELITTQVDINVRAQYQKKIWGGVSWRFQDAVAFMAGYNWNNIGDGTLGNAKIGFAYDLNTSKLFRHNVGTFEIFVNYCFGITPKPKISIHKNPLWL